ncbi:hypothetical protein HYV80_07145 [Candidatus Woesearchaeota archaeon]|nr:hypothetical protein [Candidatus Woesearchaeota archaeon]
MEKESRGGYCIAVDGNALSLIRVCATQHLMGDSMFTRLHSILGGTDLYGAYIGVLGKSDISEGTREARMRSARMLLRHEQQRPRLGSVTDAEPAVIVEEGGLAVVVAGAGSDVGVLMHSGQYGVRTQYDSGGY